MRNICTHDATATGVLTGARDGRLVSCIVCESCGVVLQQLSSERYAILAIRGVGRAPSA
jgi:hypothetical protein